MNESVKQYLAEIGRKGGSTKSEKKAAACRANARRPRPNARKANKLAGSKKSEQNS
jgi:hypothetical protein